MYARKRVQQLERKEQDLIRSLNSIERIESASVPSEVPMSAREKKNNKSSSSSSSSSSTASVVDTRARQSAWLSELSEDSIIIGKRLGSGGSGATVHNCLVDGTRTNTIIDSARMEESKRETERLWLCLSVSVCVVVGDRVVSGSIY